MKSHNNKINQRICPFFTYIEAHKITITTIMVNEDDFLFGDDVYLIVIIMGVTMILTMWINILVEKVTKKIPSCIQSICVGIIVGLVIKLTRPDILDNFHVGLKPFFLFLVPPIIYESGFTMNKKYIWKNIIPILLYAIPGTIISTGLIAALLYNTGCLSAKDSFVYGSIISAVDPVATLSVFKVFDIDPRVYTIVYGESIFNDAVSITLYDTFKIISDNGMWDWREWAAMSVAMMIIFTISFFIAMVFWLLGCFIFKYIELYRHQKVELLVYLIICYIPYILAQWLGASGILTILFLSICHSEYNIKNITPRSSITFEHGARTVSHICDMFIFIYLGMCIFTLNHVFDPWLISMTLIGCIVARFISIFLLSLVIQCNPWIDSVDYSHQIILWFTGVRGSVSLILSISEPNNALMTCSLVVILIGVFTIGIGTPFMLQLFSFQKDILHLPNEPEKKSHALKFMDRVLINHSESFKEAIYDDRRNILPIGILGE
jgi:sodium/hydrogen exchanger 3